MSYKLPQAIASRLTGEEEVQAYDRSGREGCQEQARFVVAHDVRLSTCLSLQSMLQMDCLVE
jgi:hypothetical protein